MRQGGFWDTKIGKNTEGLNRDHFPIFGPFVFLLPSRSSDFSFLGNPREPIDSSITKAEILEMLIQIKAGRRDCWHNPHVGQDPHVERFPGLGLRGIFWSGGKVSRNLVPL